MKLATKLGISGGVLTLIGTVFGWFLFPPLLRSQIASQAALLPGGEIRAMWEKVPFALDFKIYVFNVTNHQAVLQGERPVVEEVGPFIYGEWKSKANVRDSPEDDTVIYQMMDTFYFNKEGTLPLTGEEELIIPDLIGLTLIMASERKRPGALKLINKALPMLLNDGLFRKVKAKDLLFEGMRINCTSKDFSAVALCTAIKKEGGDSIKEIEPGFLGISVFGAKNATPAAGFYKAMRGTSNVKDIGRLVTWNNKTELDVWAGMPCNAIRGTDGTVFHPLRTQNDSITMFSPDLCVSMDATFTKEKEYKGFHAYEFAASLGDMTNNKKDKCFCPAPDKCLKKEVLDLFNCGGVPLLASFPHFYKADEEYLKLVRGLHPDEEKHKIELLVEPMTATPLKARKRIQFSLPIHKVEKVVWTENLTEGYIPLFWVEESIDLPEHLLTKVDHQLFLVIRIVDVIKWLFTVVGTLLIGTAFGVNYKNKQKNLVITPTDSRHPTAHQNAFGATEKGHANMGYIM